MRGCGLASLALGNPGGRRDPGSWLCVSGPRGNGALGTFVTREEREAWLGRQERLVELVEAGEEAGVEEMMADHFGTVQILGNRLIPRR